MSIDYYIRLEQGRGPHPSRQMLAAMARALMLSRDEREYLFRIAGENPPLAGGPSREVTPALRYLLDAMTETPAYLVDATYDVLAWNRLATYFIGDLSDVPDEDRNMIRWMFRQPATDGHWDRRRRAGVRRSTVADLRAAYARYPATRASGSWSPSSSAPRRFARMWHSHDVLLRPAACAKRIDHPDVGPLEFECQLLHIGDATSA